MSVSLRTPAGRPLVVLGAEQALTMDRWNAVRDRLDSDPRLVSCSLVYQPGIRERWVRAEAPGGAVIVVATDASDLVGQEPADSDDVDQWQRWFEQCRDRGLAHDWLLLSSSDVANVEPWSLNVEESSDDAPSSSIAYARDARSSGTLTVAVDATWLGPYETGAQVLTTHALAALARRSEIERIELVGVDELPEYARHLRELDSIQIVPAATKADIVWYPNQIDARVDLSRARDLGNRVVITYLDLIAYDIPRYHGNKELWRLYREQQRTTPLLVDGITTISADVAHRLLDEVPLLNPDRVRAIGLGVDHLTNSEISPTPPPDIQSIAGRLSERPFILVLGNDFLHKNRDFAIRTWQHLLDQGISCDLVLAGLHVRSSSSKEDESRALASHVNLRGELHTLGHIDAATKVWLLRNATAVHYPTSAEGFGFVPYEAAALATPTTFTRFGPLAEFIADQSLPQRWTIDSHAQDLARMLSSDDARRKRLAAIDTAREDLTWDHFAERLTDFFALTRARPPVAAAALTAPSADAGGGSLPTRLRTKSRSAAKRLLGRG